MKTEPRYGAVKEENTLKIKLSSILECQRYNTVTSYQKLPDYILTSCLSITLAENPWEKDHLFTSMLHVDLCFLSMLLSNTETKI